MARTFVTSLCHERKHEYCDTDACRCKCHGKRRHMTVQQKWKRDKYLADQNRLIDLQLKARWR